MLRSLTFSSINATVATLIADLEKVASPLFNAHYLKMINEFFQYSLLLSTFVCIHKSEEKKSLLMFISPIRDPTWYCLHL